MDWNRLLDVVLFVLTEVLLIVVSVFLTIKALMFERKTALGRAMARNNLAMALVYYSAAIAAWVSLTRHPAISIPLRLFVAITTYHAVREYVRVYGGWRNTWRELRRSASEWGGDGRRCLTHMCSLAKQRIKHIWRYSKENWKVLVLLVVLVMMVLLILMVENMGN